MAESVLIGPAAWLWLYMPCHDHIMRGTGRVHDWNYPMFTDEPESGAGEYVADWLFPLVGPSYRVELEQGEEGWGAWSPDVPGVVAVGETEAEARTLMVEAIAFHLEADLGFSHAQPGLRHAARRRLA